MDAISNPGRAFVISLALAVTSCAVAGQTKLLAVKDVSTDTENCLNVDSRQLQFACHRLYPGHMTVIAIRDFVPSKKVDGSSFSKVTIMLPRHVDSGDIFDLPNDAASVFYSRGSSAFAGKKGCYGTAISGQIEVMSVGASAIEVSVDVVVGMRSPLDWPGDCEPMRLQRTLRANWMEYDSLGTWEGKPSVGDTPFEEAHPLND